MTNQDIAIRIDPYLEIQPKRMLNDFAHIYGGYKCPQLDLGKLPTKENGVTRGTICVVRFKLFKIKRNEFITILKSPSLFLEGVSAKKSPANKLDVVAKYLSPLNIISPELNPEEEKAIIKSLKRKLAKHRKRRVIGELKMNTIPVTSSTALGGFVKQLAFVLNKCKKVSRSKRKKINRLRRKKSISYKNFLRENIIKKQNKLREQERRNTLRDSLAKVRAIKLKEKKQGLYYLKMLRRFEKACDGTDINPLDLLFPHPYKK